MDRQLETLQTFAARVRFALAGIKVGIRAIRPGDFQGHQIYEHRYPVADTQAGAVMALVRFHHDAAAPPLGAAPNRGDTVVREIFAIEHGKIVEIQATWIPPAEQRTTPWLPSQNRRALACRYRDA
jgi:hypothetical protein